MGISQKILRTDSVPITDIPYSVPITDIPDFVPSNLPNLSQRWTGTFMGLWHPYKRDSTEGCVCLGAFQWTCCLGSGRGPRQSKSDAWGCRPTKQVQSHTKYTQNDTLKEKSETKIQPSQQTEVNCRNLSWHAAYGRSNQEDWWGQIKI